MLCSSHVALCSHSALPSSTLHCYSLAYLLHPEPANAGAGQRASFMCGGPAQQA